MQTWYIGLKKFLQYNEEKMANFYFFYQNYQKNVKQNILDTLISCEGACSRRNRAND